MYAILIVFLSVPHSKYKPNDKVSGTGTNKTSTDCTNGSNPPSGIA